MKIIPTLNVSSLQPSILDEFIEPNQEIDHSLVWLRSHSYIIHGMRRMAASTGVCVRASVFHSEAIPAYGHQLAFFVCLLHV